MTDWKIFKGNNQPHDDIDRLPEPPNWRKFTGADKKIVKEIAQGWLKFLEKLDEKTEDRERGKSFRIHSDGHNERNSVIKYLGKINCIFCDKVVDNSYELEF